MEKNRPTAAEEEEMERSFLQMTLGNAGAKVATATDQASVSLEVDPQLDGIDLQALLRQVQAGAGADPAAVPSGAAAGALPSGSGAVTFLPGLPAGAMAVPSRGSAPIVDAATEKTKEPSPSRATAADRPTRGMARFVSREGEDDSDSDEDAAFLAAERRRMKQNR